MSHFELVQEEETDEGEENVEVIAQQMKLCKKEKMI